VRLVASSIVVLEAGTGERHRAPATLQRVAAAALQPQQFGAAPVELVVAHRAGRQTHQIERFNRRLVAEQRREQRAGADQVTRGNEDVVRVLAPQVGHRGGEVFGAAGGYVDRLRRVCRVLDPDAARGGQQVAVKIVDRQHLHGHRRGPARRRRRAAGKEGGCEGGQCGGEPGRGYRPAWARRGGEDHGVGVCG
jgi:hypothetical protein